MRLNDVHSLNDFVNYLYKGNDSHFMVIEGRKKSGKTDFGLDLLYRATKLGIFKRVGSNIQDLGNTPVPFDFITDLETLKETCEGYNKPYLFLFDEMGKSLPRRQPLVKLNVKFLNHLQVIRKYKLSIIGCAIGQNIDSGIMNATHLDGYIKRFDRYNKDKARYYDFIDHEWLPFYNIKRTPIKFNEYKVAVFTYQKPYNPSPFLTQEYNKLWQWAQGKTIRSLDLRVKEFHRILRKYLNESLRFYGKPNNDSLPSRGGGMGTDK